MKKVNSKIAPIYRIRA